MHDQTRLGGNAPGLPGEPLTRRGLLRGAAPLAIGLTVVPTMAMAAQAAPLTPNDVRLTALADAYEAAEAACVAHTEAHRGRPTAESDTAFDDLSDRFGPIEAEMTATPADTMAGVVAKARVFQIPTMREYPASEVLLSLVDDVWRLFGGAVA